MRRTASMSPNLPEGCPNTKKFAISFVMYKLLKKSEISGTCWVEFNISGGKDFYQHWQESSRYASLDAMYAVYDVFSICIEGFDLYCPIFLEPKKVKELSAMLDGFSSAETDISATKFAQELSFFLSIVSEGEESTWMLGV